MNLHSFLLIWNSAQSRGQLFVGPLWNKENNILLYIPKDDEKNKGKVKTYKSSKIVLHKNSSISVNDLVSPLFHHKTIKIENAISKYEN